MASVIQRAIAKATGLSRRTSGAATKNRKNIKVELYNYLREKTGAHWICAGERIADSIVRRAMIKESSSIDTKRGRFYPIAYWNVRQVRSYNKQRKLPLSLENKKLKHSFRSLMPSEVANIKQIFPSDYEKIKEMFPLVEASVKKGEFYGNS